MARPKYDWDGALNRFFNEPSPYPFRRLRAVLGFAERFVDRWADYGERVKMQPAHLLANFDPEGRGLAWRCTSSFGVDLGMSVVCFPRERHVVMEPSEDAVSHELFVYRFEPDGRTVLVVGSARREILGPHVDLAAQDSLRRQRLLNELAAEAAEEAVKRANDHAAALGLDGIVEDLRADVNMGK